MPLQVHSRAKALQQLLIQPAQCQPAAIKPAASPKAFLYHVVRVTILLVSLSACLAPYPITELLFLCMQHAAQYPQMLSEVMKHMASA